MHTGERQTTRLRTKYIQSVLNQHMSFFDIDSTKQNILQRISSDTILVQDAIGDKVQKLCNYCLLGQKNYTLRSIMSNTLSANMRLTQLVV
jgi:ABC-type multidrug transport system fused ATPase/permease subunit